MLGNRGFVPLFLLVIIAVAGFFVLSATMEDQKQHSHIGGER